MSGMVAYAAHVTYATWSLAMKIEIQSTDVDVRSGTSSRTGKAFTMRQQTAYLHHDGQPYPVRFLLTLGDTQAPYAPGFYTLNPSSIRVGRFNDLELDRFRLVLDPVVRSATRASA